MVNPDEEARSTWSDYHVGEQIVKNKRWKAISGPTSPHLQAVFLTCPSMFARYTNPHTLNDTGRTVTRHDLYHDEDTLMNDDPVEPDVTELKELDRMILQSIGLSDNGLPILSASATHTHEPRAKKRRKTHEEDRDVVRT